MLNTVHESWQRAGRRQSGLQNDNIDICDIISGEATLPYMNVYYD